jgi:hypothetical protein
MKRDQLHSSKRAASAFPASANRGKKAAQPGYGVRLTLAR